MLKFCIQVFFDWQYQKNLCKISIELSYACERRKNAHLIKKWKKKTHINRTKINLVGTILRSTRLERGLWRSSVAERRYIGFPVMCLRYSGSRPRSGLHQSCIIFPFCLCDLNNVLSVIHARTLMVFYSVWLLSASELGWNLLKFDVLYSLNENNPQPVNITSYRNHLMMKIELCSGSLLYNSILNIC